MSKEAAVRRAPSSPVVKHAGVLQRKCACGQHTIAGSECGECGKKRLQRSATGRAATDEVPHVVYDVLRSGGQPLDPSTRSLMESRFSHDFSRVRVHEDAQAAASARALNAQAYTVGQDVVFGRGRYAPQAVEGRRLLAHELAHVVQQRGGATGASLTLGKESDPRELEADRAADRVLSGATLRGTELPTTSVAQRVQRQTEEKDDEAKDAEAGNDEKKTKKKEKKLPPAERRRKIRVGDFIGDFWHRLLGRPQPKYFKGGRASSGEPKKRREYEEVKKTVAVTKSASDDESLTSPPGWFGGQPYKKGDPKTSKFPYDTAVGALFAEPDPAKPPRGGTLLDETTTTTVTGTLKFSFGEKGDKSSVGGKGRIRITAVDYATGVTTTVHDTGWITTLGIEQSVTLANPPGNARYLLELGIEEWWAGQTQYKYELQLQQKTTTVTKFEVTEKKPVKE